MSRCKVTWQHPVLDCKLCNRCRFNTFLFVFCVFIEVQKCVFIPPHTRSSGRRYSVLLQKFLSFFLSFFSFAKGSTRWLYRQGTFIAQMVGYRCNFKNWVQNLGGERISSFEMFLIRNLSFQLHQEEAPGPLSTDGIDVKIDVFIHLTFIKPLLCFKKILEHFLPLDAMLTRYILWSCVCVSVRTRIRPIYSNCNNL